jgi:hypothetical protein
MAEIELGVLMRQCLSGRIANLNTMISKVKTWEFDRNKKCATVDWQFTADNARVKLKRHTRNLSLNGTLDCRIEDIIEIIPAENNA